MYSYFFVGFTKVISFNNVVYVYCCMGSECSAASRSPVEEGAPSRRPLVAARSRDAHLTDTVKQGQFRENDLKELNLS